jgi:hypothetical protein
VFFYFDLLQRGTDMEDLKSGGTYFNESRSKVFVGGHHVQLPIFGRLLLINHATSLHLLLELLNPVVPSSCSTIVVVCGASTAPEVLVSALVASLPCGHPIAIYAEV